MPIHARIASAERSAVASEKVETESRDDREETAGISEDASEPSRDDIAAAAVENGVVVAFAESSEASSVATCSCCCCLEAG